MESNDNIKMKISVSYTIGKHCFKFKESSFEKLLDAIIKETKNPNSEFKYCHANELCQEVIIPELNKEEERLLAQIEAASKDTGN